MLPLVVLVSDNSKWYHYLVSPKSYFLLFPFIIVFFSLIGLINIINNFPNYLLGSVILTFFPMLFSFAIFSLIKVSNPPKWHLSLTQKLPPLLLGIIIIVLSLLNSVALFPLFLGKLPLGTLNTLTLSLYLNALLQYESAHKSQIFLLKTIIILFLFSSFLLIIVPTIKATLIGWYFSYPSQSPTTPASKYPFPPIPIHFSDFHTCFCYNRLSTG